MRPYDIKKKRMMVLMSQTEFAEKLGVTRQTVSFWERGIKKPTKEHEQRIKEITKQIEIVITV